MNPQVDPARGTERTPEAPTLAVAEDVVALRRDRAQLAQVRRVALTVLITPALGTAAAVWRWRLGDAPALPELTLFAGLFVATMFSIESGFHRHFSHKAFEAHPAVRWLLALFGSMAGQGSIIFYAATHRHHHAVSDREGDPHSPNLSGGLVRGVWRAQVGWMPKARYWEHLRLVPDLLRDPMVFAMSERYLAISVLGLALPAALDGLWRHSWHGALLGLLWGGLVRAFAVQHLCWLTNSVGHLAGGRPFESRDRSTNLRLLALLNAGMSLHNTHHAFPATASNQLRRFDLDPSAWFIRLIERLGLASKVHVPSDEAIAQRLRR